MADADPRQPSELEALERTSARRHSCRAFLPEPVDPALIARIVGVAARSPSWCNVQPWSIRVVSSAARRALGDAMLDAFDRGGGGQPDLPFPAAYEGAYADRRRESGFGLYAALGVARDDKPRRTAEMRRNFDFFAAPHVLIVSTPASLLPYGMVDCGIFIGGFMLAAEAAGLGAIAQASVALYSPLLRSMLSVPEEERIVCGIAFGHRDGGHPANGFRTTRIDDAGALFIDTFEDGTA